MVVEEQPASSSVGPEQVLAPELPLDELLEDELGPLDPLELLEPLEPPPSLPPELPEPPPELPELACAMLRVVRAGAA